MSDTTLKATDADRVAAATPAHVAQRRRRGMSDRTIAWLFIGPTILLLLTINIVPLVWTIYLSFTNYRADQPNAEIHDVGLRNYEQIFADGDISLAMQPTGHFVFWTILLETLTGFGLAYLLDKKFRGHGFWTTIILIPMMLSPAVVGNFWKFIYEPEVGLFNYIVSIVTGVERSTFQMLGEESLAPWAIIIVDVWMWTPLVMLICLAGLRSVPDHIYESAEVDRASRWRQFWSITLPMALPFIMLAVLFRGIENLKMFDMVNVLTGGGPGSATELASITLKQEAFESWNTGYSSALAIILFVAVFVLSYLYARALRRVKRRSSVTTANSGVEPTRLTKQVASLIVIAYALLTMIPLVWIVATSFKTPSDSIAYPPKVVFTPSLEGYLNLFTTSTQQTPEQTAGIPPDATWYDKLAHLRSILVDGPSNVVHHFTNSIVIAFGSTFLAVFLGVFAAYGFSRFKVPFKDSLLFLILATRFIPPLTAAIPIYPIYRDVGLTDSKLGMILLYAALNVSLAVWLLKSFIDDIPPEYEEAAMVDGYSRLQAFIKVVLPRAKTGIAATAIFCLIFAWNEYTFAFLLTSGEAQTMPPFISIITGEGGQDWPTIAAGTTLFLAPVCFFTILLRKHLPRAITFGAIRK